MRNEKGKVITFKEFAEEEKIREIKSAYNFLNIMGQGEVPYVQVEEFSKKIREIVIAEVSKEITTAIEYAHGLCTCEYSEFLEKSKLIEVEEKPHRKGMLIFTKVKIRLFSDVDDQSISKIKRDYSKTVDILTQNGKNHTIKYISVMEVRRGKRSQSQFLTIKLKGWEYDENGFVIL